jgi:ABC-type transport system substrate-binding protein
MFGGRSASLALRGALLRGALAGVLLALLAACGGAPATTTSTGAATPAAGGASAGAPQPGGTMSVAYQNDIATLDPAIGYDWNNWPMEKMVFDALMDYDKGTTLVPQLAAEMPKVNADATVYSLLHFAFCIVHFACR